jgi:hypothetical protein
MENDSTQIKVTLLRENICKTVKKYTQKGCVNDPGPEDYFTDPDPSKPKSNGSERNRLWRVIGVGKISSSVWRRGKQKVFGPVYRRRTFNFK